MRRYFINLFLALAGHNPYRMELDEKTRQLENAADNMRSLNDMYFSAVDRWSAAEKQLTSLQQLVENLRERISDKDAELEAAGHEFHDRMERMKADYQRRIEDYNLKIEDLQQKK